MSSENVIEQLTGNPFFSGVREEDLVFLADHARRRGLSTGEPLFRHGEAAEHFYVIADGRVALEVVALEGPSLELQELGKDAVLGWSWLIHPYKWNFTARAAEPTEVIEIDGISVLERCELEPRFGYELLKRFSGLMSDRLAHARRRMMEEWSAAGFA